MRHAAHRHTPFLHALQQCGLGLRGRPVDLIRQQHVGENRPAPEGEGPVSLIPLCQHHGPRDIRRHQVRRKLDPLEIERQGFRETADHQCFGQSRNAGHHAMPPGKQRGQDLVERLLLPDDRLAHLIQQTSARCGEGRDQLQGVVRQAVLKGAVFPSLAWGQVDRKRGRPIATEGIFVRFGSFHRRSSVGHRKHDDVATKLLRRIGLIPATQGVSNLVPATLEIVGAVDHPQLAFDFHPEQHRATL